MTASVTEIHRDLTRLGVEAGDLVMVHASLRRIGPVEGGAAGVLDATEKAIGTGGTILMVLGARDDWAWVNEGNLDPDYAALLAEAEPFNAEMTPADPEVGVLGEVFRTRPGSLVSDHPEGRFAASGRLAGWLIEDVAWDDYYGKRSPLERFLEASGRVLRLGADLDTVTLLHYAEWLVPIEGKRRVRRTRKVSGPSGPRLVTVEALDDVHGIVDYPGEDYFVTITREYLESGRAVAGRVGNTTAELIDGRDLVEFGVEWMLKHLDSPSRESTDQTRATTQPSS